MNVTRASQNLLVSLAGWIKPYQFDVIAHIQDENKIPTSKLSGKRIRSTNNVGRRLVVKGT